MTQAWPLEHVMDVKLLLHMTVQEVPVSMFQFDDGLPSPLFELREVKAI